MNIAIRSFKGIAPKIEPRYLPDGAAQIAVNVVAEGQALRPLRAPGSLDNPPYNAIAAGVKTIYRGWQDAPDDTRYWLSSPYEADVCRSQIAGDVCEWTFISRPGFKLCATNSPLASESYTGTVNPGVLPNSTIHLGLPAPTVKLDVSVSSPDPETDAATLTLTQEDLAQLITYDFQRDTYGFFLSVNKGQNWYYPQALADPVTKHSTLPNKAGTILTAGDIAGLAWADGINVSVDGGATRFWFALTKSGADFSAADLVTGLLAPIATGYQIVNAAVRADGGVSVWSWVAGAKAGLELSWNLTTGGVNKKSTPGTSLTAAQVKDMVDGLNCLAGDPTFTVKGTSYLVTALVSSEAGGPQSLKLTRTEGCLTSDREPFPEHTTKTACEAANGIWMAEGKDSAVSVRWGPGYGQTKAATGTTADLGTYESRVYVYTWVFKANLYELYGYTPLAGCPWDWESAPSPPSESANVYADSTVTLTRSSTWDTDYPQPNWIRLYRSVAGQYLLVGEGPLFLADGSINPAALNWQDTKSAAELGEPCPSLTWSPPPSRAVAGVTEYLNGLINLPNGMMAGFLGRDVYFCEPYRPFAWPENYIQTLDSPIVGLGRMDTTLAVLTKGAPYFLQGSEPGNMNVVKGDLEQACVSKRSIVSMGRNVFYASPDGLVMLFPGGSAVVTESLISRSDWQILQPDKIHAYGHDGKYIAFFDPDAPEPVILWGRQAGGFVMDLVSKQFYLHTYIARAGYTDLRNDALYLATNTNPPTLLKWGRGVPSSTATGLWKSKIFGFPQGTGFSCGQVEAGPLRYRPDGVHPETPAYPVTLRIYVDGALFHTVTIPSTTYYDDVSRLLLSQRAPFRLPPLVKADGTVFTGRDWEIEIDVTSEIFNVVLAQSMSEIASV